MNKQNKDNEIELVACEVCLKQIPKTDSHNTEVNDYVLNFCGLECYKKWQTDNPENGAE